MFHPVQDFGDTMLLLWFGHQELLLGQVRPQTVTSRTSALNWRILPHVFMVSMCFHVTWRFWCLSAGSEGSTCCLSGICSPLSIDQTRSNVPSSKGCFKAFATWRVTCIHNLMRKNQIKPSGSLGTKEIHFTAGESELVTTTQSIFFYISFHDMFYTSKRRVLLTKLDNPWEAVMTFPLAAWTGLSVIALTFVSYFRAKYRALPPIPQPTSTTWVGLSSLLSTPSNCIVRNHLSSIWHWAHDMPEKITCKYHK